MNTETQILGGCYATLNLARIRANIEAAAGGPIGDDQFIARLTDAGFAPGERGEFFALERAIKSLGPGELVSTRPI